MENKQYSEKEVNEIFDKLWNQVKHNFGDAKKEFEALKQRKAI